MSDNSRDSRSRSPEEQIDEVANNLFGSTINALGNIGAKPGSSARAVLGNAGGAVVTAIDVGVSLLAGEEISARQVGAAALGVAVGIGFGVAAAATFPASGPLAVVGFFTGAIFGGIFGGIAERGVAGSECFPGDTSICTNAGPLGISSLREGDFVLAYSADESEIVGQIVEKRVTRTYRNATKEWIKLTWLENSQHKELVATPGHRFLDEFGQFRRIGNMIQNGRATVVLASGEVTEVEAERIVWSAETAHMFERAHTAPATFGNLALKPQPIEGWQTYNFEVEDFHTYIAGGVRVHNDSGFLGAIGNTIDSALNAFGPVGDLVGDVVGGAFHAVGSVVGAVGSAIGGIAAGIGEAVGGVAAGIGAAIGGVADAIGSVFGGR